MMHLESGLIMLRSDYEAEHPMGHSNDESVDDGHPDPCQSRRVASPRHKGSKYDDSHLELPKVQSGHISRRRHSVRESLIGRRGLSGHKAGGRPAHVGDPSWTPLGSQSRRFYYLSDQMSFEVIASTRAVIDELLKQEKRGKDLSTS